MEEICPEPAFHLRPNSGTDGQEEGVVSFSDLQGSIRKMNACFPLAVNGGGHRLLPSAHKQWLVDGGTQERQKKPTAEQDCGRGGNLSDNLVPVFTNND